jgi:CRISPR-associated endonuclease/helicase Cas3
LLAQLPTSASGVDGSPAALVGLRERSKSDANVARLLVEATTPAPLHPPLTRPLLDAWAMTSLEVHTGRPEVDPWLRGWVDDDEPQTTVVFREHLPLVDGKRLFDTAQLQAFLDAAGPHAAERIETEAWRVMRWLTDRLERVVDDATLPGFLKGADQLWALLLGESQSLPISRARLRDKRDRDRTERALAGATLLVDARLGGLAAGLLDEDAGAPAADQGSLDLTQMDGPVPFRVRRVSALEDAYSPSPGFRLERAFEAAFDEDGGPVAWLVVERRLEEQPLTEAGRSVARRAQGLAEHQSWVESEADAIATRLGLDPSLARALRVAARLHDEGKRAERWQRAFRVPVEDRPLAKSLRAPNIAMLGGYRHELGSLPRVERDAEFLSLDEPLRDLVLHLVAAHHGRARPVLPTDGAEEPPARLIVRAREVALRFDRLSRRFGPWGLAWLESLLRAADQRASRRNDEVGDG